MLVDYATPSEWVAVSLPLKIAIVCVCADSYKSIAKLVQMMLT